MSNIQIRNKELELAWLCGEIPSEGPCHRLAVVYSSKPAATAHWHTYWLYQTAQSGKEVGSTFHRGSWYKLTWRWMNTWNASCTLVRSINLRIASGFCTSFCNHFCSISRFHCRWVFVFVWCHRNIRARSKEIWLRWAWSEQVLWINGRTIASSYLCIILEEEYILMELEHTRSLHSLIKASSLYLRRKPSIFSALLPP